MPRYRNLDDHEVSTLHTFCRKSGIGLDSTVFREMARNKPRDRSGGGGLEVDDGQAVTEEPVFRW